MALQAKLAIKGIVLSYLDGIALGVEVIKLNIATFESLTQMAGHLRRVGHVVQEELGPDGRNYHEMRMRPVVIGVDGYRDRSRGHEERPVLLLSWDADTVCVVWGQVPQVPTRTRYTNGSKK